MGHKKKTKKITKSTLEKSVRCQHSVLHSAEKEIYENISQCLFLARLRIGSVHPGENKNSTEAIGETGLLIGKALKDLRNLAKQLSACAKKNEP